MGSRETEVKSSFHVPEINLKVGDLVQWESQGTLMFSDPLPITDFSPCGQFCFVEGSRTGIPVWQVEVIKKD